MAFQLPGWTLLAGVGWLFVKLLCIIVRVLYSSLAAIESRLEQYLRREWDQYRRMRAEIARAVIPSILPPLPDEVAGQILRRVMKKTGPSRMLELRTVSRAWRRSVTTSIEWTCFNTTKLALKLNADPMLATRERQAQRYWKEVHAMQTFLGRDSVIAEEIVRGVTTLVTQLMETPREDLGRGRIAYVLQPFPHWCDLQGSCDVCDRDVDE